MPDYSKSVIYRLVCKDLYITECYVGSTTNFKSRKRQHKSCCNTPNCKEYNYKVYQFIRQHGGWDNWDMIMVEEFPCDNKLQLHKREREVFETLNGTLNSEVPSRTQKQRYEDNKEKLSKIGKEQIGCRICKCMVRKDNFKRHTKSPKHINNL